MKRTLCLLLVLLCCVTAGCGAPKIPSPEKYKGSAWTCKKPTMLYTVNDEGKPSIIWIKDGAMRTLTFVYLEGNTVIGYDKKAEQTAANRLFTGQYTLDEQAFSIELQSTGDDLHAYSSLLFTRNK